MQSEAACRELVPIRVLCTRTADWLDTALGGEFMVMGDIILTEVLQGFQSDEDFDTAKSLLLTLPFMEMAGRDMAIESAMNCRFLRKKGVTVRKAIDMMIGTFCIHNSIPLLHGDKDFEPMQKYLKLKSVAP